MASAGSAMTGGGGDVLKGFAFGVDGEEHGDQVLATS